MIIGMRVDLLCYIGAYVRANGMTPVPNVAQFTAGPYRVPNFRLNAHAMLTNKTPSGTFRGPGRFEGCFFMERLMDVAARDLKLDRLAIRRRNLIPLKDMPYRLPDVEPNDGFGSTSCDSADYTSPFDRCVPEAGRAAKGHLLGQLIHGSSHGLVIACFIGGG